LYYKYINDKNRPGICCGHFGHFDKKKLFFGFFFLFQLSGMAELSPPDKKRKRKDAPAGAPAGPAPKRRREVCQIVQQIELRNDGEEGERKEKERREIRKGGKERTKRSSEASCALLPVTNSRFCPPPPSPPFFCRILRQRWAAH
jgi:hypothetical protein